MTFIYLRKYRSSISLFQFYYFHSKNRINIRNEQRPRPVIYDHLFRCLSTKTKEEYFKHFETLQLRENSSPVAVRESFIELAKKYHPDSGHALADAVKFSKIENAYRKIMEKFNNDRHNNDCEGEFGLYYKDNEIEEEESTGKLYDIKQASVHHRQYLSFQGIGIGTPSQREKQFSKFLAMRATEHVIDYKVKQLSQNSDETSLVNKNKQAARNIRTRYGIDRIVEDKIQESIAKGDFDNLPNAGKPLKYQNHNPYVDTITFKLNQVLINNGYAPEWVMLEKEIRDDRKNIREAIVKGRSTLGPTPLSLKMQRTWDNRVANLAQNVKELNKKIDKYNFLVPIMTKQTVHFSLEKELEKVLNEYVEGSNKPVENNNNYSSLDNTIVSSSSIVYEKIGLKTIIKIFKGK